MRSARCQPRAWTLVVAALALAPVLSACSLTPSRSTTELHRYLLSPDLSGASDPAPSDKRIPAVLLVNVPRAQAGFDSQRMVYLLRPHELRYYADNQWADQPARMLARLLTQALDRSGATRIVAQMPSAARGDYRLDADDLAIQQEFFSQPSRLRLTLRLQLVELPAQTVIATRPFDIVEAAPSDDAYGGVLAANQAVARLVADVVSWVGVCLNGQGPRRC